MSRRRDVLRGQEYSVIYIDDDAGEVHRLETGTKRYEVRCCCDAGLLLGFMSLPEVDLGSDRGRILKVPRHGLPAALIEISRLTSYGQEKCAVKSNDMGLDWFKTFPQFTEATPADRAEARRKGEEYEKKRLHEILGHAEPTFPICRAKTDQENSSICRAKTDQENSSIGGSVVASDLT